MATTSSSKVTTVTTVPENIINTILADVTAIMPDFVNLVNSYRLLVGAAEELRRTAGISPDVVARAIDRTDRSGMLVDIIIDLLCCKITFASEFLSVTCAPVDLFRYLANPYDVADTPHLVAEEIVLLEVLRRAQECLRGGNQPPCTPPGPPPYTFATSCFTPPPPPPPPIPPEPPFAPPCFAERPAPPPPPPPEAPPPKPAATKKAVIKAPPTEEASSSETASSEETAAVATASTTLPSAASASETSSTEASSSEESRPDRPQTWPIPSAGCSPLRPRRLKR